MLNKQKTISGIIILVIIFFAYSCIYVPDDYYNKTTTTTLESTETSTTTTSIENSTTTTVTYIDNSSDYVFPDEQESDDNSTDAFTVLLDTEYSYTISSKDDIDFVTIQMEPNAIYYIKLYSIKGFEPEVTLLDTDAQTIIEMKNTGTYTGDYDWWGYDKDRNYSPLEKESIVYQPPTSGKYFITISDIYSAHTTGIYKIKVSRDVTIGKSQSINAIPHPSEFQIDLTWDAVPSVDGYKIYRTDVSQDIDNPVYTDFDLIKTINSQSTLSYSDKTIEPDVTYYYYITAFIGNEDGDPSMVDDAVFLWNNFKPTSSLINATEGLSNRIEIELIRKYDNSNILRYDVYRSSSDTSPDYTFVDSFESDAPVGDKITDTADGVNLIADDSMYYFYCVKIIISQDGNESESKYSYFDSGLAAP